MRREVLIMRFGQEVWRGWLNQPTPLGATADYFCEAWRRALTEGAVVEADAGLVQFRFACVEPERH